MGLYGSGSNYYGELGLGNNTNVNILTPMILPNGKKASAITTGYSFSIVLIDGLVYGTGYNQDGELGIGNNNNINTLTQMLAPTGSQYITNVTYLMNEGFIHSDICFAANTPISTDQGTIMIQNINSNTINGKKIICTRTISNQQYLVCFEKNSLGLNYPNKRTVMSQGHGIFHKGKFIIAKKFLGYTNKIYKIKYNGECLYNILMEKYSKINVNNMICETLDPSNTIGKLYKSSLSTL
jgi:hypothetical protein